MEGVVAGLDLQGVVVGWSPAAERLLGYSAREILNQPASALLAEGEVQAVDMAAQCRAQGSWRGTVALRHHDGSTARPGRSHGRHGRA
ncbi:PAS domain-containing protein [Streptomyces sp. CA-210063]|uniref:PAS domain-containing protein n=1 Tax=Streptomyces sp. CA-210063 TaxID=2801029 RepID=UPI00214CDBC6|nr:PAS domain-containing protein [Streptomyces sp. CA-210063]UUU36628.1 PAS domain-containing protein [Streptomyces sp. CA-210063]